MRLAYLGAASSIHNQRWVRGLAERGVEVLLLSQHEPLAGYWGPNVRIERLRASGPAGYFLNAPQVAAASRRFDADLLHAHYATGYGLCGALSRVSPNIVSVWGADIFDAPSQSAAYRAMVRYVLRRADAVSSTSHVMAAQAVAVSGIPTPVVVPFGIDTQRFAPISPSSSEEIVIGTVKTLERKYGIDTLIEGFALLRQRPDIENSGLASRLRLRIVGGGTLRSELEALSESLGVADATCFVGEIAHDDVPAELNRIDVYVAMSRLDSESFGVAILEASACGLPVVVSDAGGLPEVVMDGTTGWVVPRERPDVLEERLAGLVLSPEQRSRFGAAGREHVLANYRWERCIDQMQALYERVLTG